jgi:hypothetical protein
MGKSVFLPFWKLAGIALIINIFIWGWESLFSPTKKSK